MRKRVPWIGLSAFGFGLMVMMPRSVGADDLGRHREVAQEVFDRLTMVVDAPADWKIWPPALRVADDQSVNAYASFDDQPNGRFPLVVIHRGLIEKVAKFDPDVLAFTMGHEIGHLVHGHGAKRLARIEKFGEVGAATSVVAAAREEELEADLFGMQVALKAGYSHMGIRKNLLGMTAPEAGSPYCAFEGLGASHPAWDSRAIFLQQDEVQAQLWRSMASFRNGVLFLETENYVYAEFCFRRVTEEFPECFESWANLGYALLMQYCDALDKDDLKSFDIGHLVVGGFYRRPDSLTAQIRGIDQEIWYEAVGAFREALRLHERLGLKDDLLLVKANLAVAHLVHPGGKQVGEAEKYFSEVFQALKRPENADALEPLVKAAIYINAGAGRGLDEAQLGEVASALKTAADQGAGTSRVAQIQAAMGYTEARQLATSAAASDRNAAFAKLEAYLSAMSPASSWWPLAYAEYERLAKGLNKPPKSLDAFAKPGVHDWRPINSVTLKDGVLLGLAQPLDEALVPLGMPEAVVPVIAGTNLKRRYYPNHGISVLGSREVLALFLESNEAPSLALLRPGLAGAGERLAVGMSRRHLESLLGDDWDVEFASIDDPQTVYRLYRDVGVAALFDGDVVSKLVVVVVPRKS